LNVESSTPFYSTYWDGFVGVRPNGDKNGFLSQLKEKGLIDHQVVSFYLTTGLSTIKFGSYD